MIFGCVQLIINLFRLVINFKVTTLIICLHHNLLLHTIIIKQAGFILK